MTAEQLQLLFAAFAEASLLGGFLGAMLYMLLRGACISVWARVEASEWYQDWQDRAYVRWLNTDTAKRIRDARQNGFISPLVLFSLAGVVLALVAACSSPKGLFTPRDIAEHEAWVERARSW
jgi:hypothetical protein